MSSEEQAVILHLRVQSLCCQAQRCKGPASLLAAWQLQTLHPAGQAAAQSPCRAADTATSRCCDARPVAPAAVRCCHCCHSTLPGRARPSRACRRHPHHRSLAHRPAQQRLKRARAPAACSGGVLQPAEP